MVTAVAPDNAAALQAIHQLIQTISEQMNQRFTHLGTEVAALTAQVTGLIERMDRK